MHHYCPPVFNHTGGSTSLTVINGNRIIIPACWTASMKNNKALGNGIFKPKTAYTGFHSTQILKTWSCSVSSAKKLQGQKHREPSYCMTGNMLEQTFILLGKKGLFGYNRLLLVFQPVPMTNTAVITERVNLFAEYGLPERVYGLQWQWKPLQLRRYCIVCFESVIWSCIKPLHYLQSPPQGHHRQGKKE